MLLALLKYWQIGAGAVGAFVLAWMLHSLDVNRIESNQRDALAAQETKLAAACEASKAITTEVSNAYQDQIADLNAKLLSVKRLRPSRCIALSAPVPAGGRDATPTGAEPARTDGINSDALYDFAGEAEKYRLQLIACQKFIVKVWDTRGHQ